MHYDSLKALLQKDGKSLTKPRKVIFDVLLNQEPIDMKAVIKRTAGKLDRATVYRNIELFEKLGIVHRVNIGWKYKIELSDVFHGHHHHFYCTNCGNMFTLEASAMLETMIDTVAAKSSFSPRGHQLEIYGFCKKCSKTKA